MWIDGVHRIGGVSPRHRYLKLALARLPSGLGRALRRFEEITGLTAVSSLATSGAPGVELSPPAHPVCFRRIDGLGCAPLPCREGWLSHLARSVGTGRSHEHVCPLGLRCACVPVVFADRIVGAVKLVCGLEEGRRGFTLARELLERVVTSQSEDLHKTALAEELAELRANQARIASAKRAPASRLPIRAAPRESTGPPPVMIRVLDHLGAHYADPDLSLRDVARVAGLSEKYLAHLFVRRVGERMHAHVNGLRVRHACELLVRTDLQIKRIARDCGFRGGPQFREVFRRVMGVTASEYRRVFQASD